MPIEPVVAPLLEFAAERRLARDVSHGHAMCNSDVLAVAEVARGYPQTQFILGCGGFADMWFEIPGAMADVPNLWLETSHTLGDGIRAMLKAAGPAANHFRQRRAEQLLCIGAQVLGKSRFRRRHEDVPSCTRTPVGCSD